jgi:hypothetical protein
MRWQYVLFSKAIDPTLRTNTRSKRLIQISEDDDFSRLGNGFLFDKAIEWLVRHRMIECILDDFGPPIYRQLPSLEHEWENLALIDDNPFSKYDSVGQSRSWLVSALDKLNETYTELGISASDFENPDAAWQPLPLDRKSIALQVAIDAIDKTVEQVRSDNGYNATLPEERNFVLDALSRASQILREASTTSTRYIKVFVFDPLLIVAQRFKGAALGITATAAKEAIIEWLKEVGVAVLKNLF